MRGKLLREHIKSKKPLECSSDGVLAEGYGSKGFAITTGKNVLWKGSGPVDGATKTASSCRSELFGLAGLFDLLLLVQTIYLPRLLQDDQKIDIEIWIDSTSASNPAI